MRDRYERRRGLVWLAAAGLIGAHIWAPDPGGVLAGVLPWDLALHLGWMLAAGLLIEVMTRVAWRDVDGGRDG